MDDDQTGDFQILSLSGGGMRGLYTAKVLADLEQSLADKHDQPDYWIGQHFDLICGTSIGGILALGLASGISARDLLNKLDNERLNIFPPSSNGRFAKIKKTWKQARNGLYSAEPLRKVLESLFEEKTLGEMKTRVLVPTVNYTTGLVQVFKTPHHEAFQRDWKLKIVDIALATSAAPTYFPIHKINDCWYVDGGLAANSPALMSIHEACHFLNQKHRNLRLMLVGTMGLQKTADPRSRRQRGYLAWGAGRDLIDLTLSANEGLHNQIGSHLIQTDRFLELDDKQTPDQSNVLALDNASDEAASILRGRGSMRAQAAMNNPVYEQIINHQAGIPTFYYGPKKSI
jgi:patatin-like phospholipase/acyl hydrolase